MTVLIGVSPHLAVTSAWLHVQFYTHAFLFFISTSSSVESLFISFVHFLSELCEFSNLRESSPHSRYKAFVRYEAYTYYFFCLSISDDSLDIDFLTTQDSNVSEV